jgi:hypothetical protein
MLSSIPRILKQFVPHHNAKYAPFPIFGTCSSWYDHQNNIWQGIRITNVLSLPFFPVTCKFIPPLSKYITYHPILNNRNWISSFFPFPFIYLPFIHLKVQPKNVQTVTMWWNNLYVTL